jgi:hypothetical protein
MADAPYTPGIPAEALSRLPLGTVIMWIHDAHASIPADWIVCDGTHGTPNPDMTVHLAQVNLAPGSTACFIQRIAVSN